MSKKPGLASAAETPPSGVTTLASRFDSPPPPSSNPSSRVSDLASRFSASATAATSALPLPSSSSAPSRASAASSKPPASRAAASPPDPASLSKKVSDLQRAFSASPPPAGEALSARARAFAKADSESRVTAFARRLDSSDGPTERVAGVARAFESRDSGAARPAFAPRLPRRTEERKEPVHEQVDRFDVVASRFEKGVAGREKEGQEGGGEGSGQARERFLDAAKRFGG